MCVCVCIYIYIYIYIYAVSFKITQTLFVEDASSARTKQCESVYAYILRERERESDVVKLVTNPNLVCVCVRVWSCFYHWAVLQVFICLSRFGIFPLEILFFSLLCSKRWRAVSIRLRRGTPRVSLSLSLLSLFSLSLALSLALKTLTSRLRHRVIL